jgi:outer membrane murein-binding lipoprotein Lpp
MGHPEVSCGIGGAPGAMKLILQTTIVLSLMVLSVGCRDARLQTLEQRVNRLEESVRQLESERNKIADDDSARRAKLEACVSDANAAFDRDLASNGTKARNGGYNVSVPILAEMQRQKQGKIEECRLLYSK